MKKLKVWKHEKEFDTKTILTDLGETPADTKKTVDRKTLADSEIKITIGKKTQVYEPRPLTPDDDIYEDIIEQFASAPTKPKYWFEEFGDYWSCSCGHINKGDRCKSCGLERDLLRSLFILHKPSYAVSKLDKKVRKAKKQVDKEELQHQEKEERRKEREASGGNLTKVVPIDQVPGAETDAETVGESAAETDPEHTNDQNISESTAHRPPTKIKYTEINVAEAAGADKSKGKKKTVIIIFAIIVCLVFIATGGYIIYERMAAPAMKYEEAQELQAAGKYQQAIETYEVLGDYKDAQALIWECYVAMADDQYEDGKYYKAIETYQIAMDMGIAIDADPAINLNDKIRNCYIAIGDKQYSIGEYTKALDAYAIAAKMEDSEELQNKINAAKFAYVKVYQKDRTAQVEQYMAQLMEIKYDGIQEIYDAYYAWHVKIVANTSETDHNTDMDTVSRMDTVYFHVSLSGGEPNEVIELYYEVIWPNGDKQIYGLDSKWQNGSKITARFQYPIPLFGREGDLIFTLYDKNTNEKMGSDSIVFRN